MPRGISFDRAQSDAVRAASTEAHFVDPLPALCQGKHVSPENAESRILFADYGHFANKTAISP